jgi:hypothetical protein
MTDVMAVGTYPDNPLPGPRRIREFTDWFHAHEPIRVVDYDFYRKFTEKHGPPQPSPILEEPMFFPGLAWKGTSGMPQHRYAWKGTSGMPQHRYA